METLKSIKDHTGRVTNKEYESNPFPRTKPTRPKQPVGAGFIRIQKKQEVWQPEAQCNGWNLLSHNQMV